jgi:hypothetical protein
VEVFVQGPVDEDSLSYDGIADADTALCRRGFVVNICCGATLSKLPIHTWNGM